MKYLLLILAVLCSSVSAQTVSNGWTKRFDFPVLSSNGYSARPQAIIALGTDTLLVSAHYGDVTSKAYKVSTAGAVLGSFTFPAPYKHVAAISRRADGSYWAAEYLTGKLLKLDLDASLETGTAVLLEERPVQGPSVCCALEWATVAGSEYLLLAEYRTSGTPVTTILRNETGRSLQMSLRVQGITYKDGLLYIASNVVTGQSPAVGMIQVIDFDTFIELGGEQDAWTNYIVDQFPAPSNYPEDLTFTPDGTLWTMTEGNTGTGTAGYLAVWSKAL